MSLVKNTILYLTSTILVKATTFFLLPFYSYLVSPEEYGYVYIVSALSAFMMILMQMSTQVCISRFLFDCKSDYEIKSLYSTIVLTATFSSTLLFLVVWFLGGIISDAINLPLKYFRIASLIPYIGLFYNLILSLLYAKQEAKKVSITTSILGIINIVIQVLLVLNMEDKAMALILSMLLNSIITFGVFLVYSRPYFVLRFDIARIKKYLYYAFSQMPSDLSAWLVSFTDRVVINKFIGPSQTGIYGIGSTIGTIPSVIYSSMNQVYVPYAYSKFKMMENGEEEGVVDLVKTTEILSVVVIVVISFFVVFSNNIVSIFSPAYASSFFIVVVMLIASMFDIFRVIYMQPLCFNIKYVKIKSAIWLFSGLINMGLNFMIIPHYGIYGGCLTSLAMHVVTFGLLLHYSKKAIRVNYKWNIIWKFAAMSLVLFAVLLLGNSIMVLALKVVLFVIYLFISGRILNLNILKYVRNYVQIFSNKLKGVR